MPQIIFALLPNMLATSTSWPADMFNAANQVAQTLCPEKEPVTLTTAGLNLDPIECQTPLSVVPDKTFDEIRYADLIYLPALWRNPRPILRTHKAIIPWLQQHYENGSIISGVGTGCCFMAEAGLLDLKPATTHWYYFEQFQKQYPQVQLKRQHFITQSGKLYCAASINSLADLTVHFIGLFFNKAVARHVERHFSHEIRQAYETVSYLEDHNVNHSDEDILQIQLWMRQHLSRSIKIEALAKQFGMSVRNLNRRFKEATGKKPSTYLQEARMSTAKDLLQSSNLSIGDIADKVGYQDVSYFTQLFRNRLGITPGQYRTTVRAKLFHDKNYDT